MAWIKSQQSLRDHPKLKKLSRLLEISVPAAFGHLHMLWFWALDYAQDGDLTPFDALDIAEASGWDGDPEAFIDAMLKCGFRGAGFFERTEDGFLILHDWEENCGEEFNKRAKEAQRLREYRKNQKNKKQEEADKSTDDEPLDVNCDSRTSTYAVRNDVRTKKRTSTYTVRGEEKRREERKRDTPPTPPGGGDGGESEKPNIATVRQVAELWNSELVPLGFPKITKVTDDRTKRFKARLNELAARREMVWWREQISRLADSDFMRTSAAEKAQWLDFDWILNEKNLVKVTEGKYSRAHGLAAKASSSQSMDEYLQELQKDPFWGGGEQHDGEGQNGVLSLPEGCG